MEEPSESIWPRLVGEVIVLDLVSPYVVLGRLVSIERDYLRIDQADTHDLRDAQTTREKYILDRRQHGIQPNRATVWIHLREVVGVSRLADVLTE